MTRILAGDIGGTKTLLELSEAGPEEFRTIAEARYESRHYGDLVPLVEDFLIRAGNPLPEVACFAVAGPVRKRCARVTNLPWVLDADVLAQRLGIGNVLLINDFQGIGYGLEALDAAGLFTLQAGKPETGGTRALLGAGTGLGQALLVWHGAGYEVLGSEGGHVDFAPRDALEADLLASLWQQGLRVSYETLLSGAGLVRIFEFLLESGRVGVGNELAEALQHAVDPAALISEFALKRSDPAAVEALERFVRIYGAQAGNLALNFLPTGGLYIAGGIAPKILSALRSGVFKEAFNAKPPMTALLETIPVHVVLDTRAGLYGARLLARRWLER